MLAEAASPVQITPRPGRGLGVVAARDIRCGEQLLVDAPLLLVPLTPDALLCGACLRHCAPAPADIPTAALELSPEAFPALPVACEGGCGAWFCSEACRSAERDRHALLCAAGSREVAPTPPPPPVESGTPTSPATDPATLGAVCLC